MNTIPPDEPLAALLERELTERHGVLMSGSELRRTLGYLTSDAFRQALARRTIPVPVFAIANRRGKFALTKEVAAWLAAQRAKAIDRQSPHHVTERNREGET